MEPKILYQQEFEVSLNNKDAYHPSNKHKIFCSSRFAFEVPIKFDCKAIVVLLLLINQKRPEHKIIMRLLGIVAFFYGAFVIQARSSDNFIINTLTKTLSMPLTMPDIPKLPDDPLALQSPLPSIPAGSSGSDIMYKFAQRLSALAYQFLKSVVLQRQRLAAAKKTQIPNAFQTSPPNGNINGLNGPSSSQMNTNQNFNLPLLNNNPFVQSPQFDTSNTNNLEQDQTKADSLVEYPRVDTLLEQVTDKLRDEKQAIKYGTAEHYSK
jgi:hypothetical protein